MTDDEGDKATDTVTVTVTAPDNAAPVIREAEATPTTGTAPLEVWFHAVADDPEGEPLTYRWEFGDGTGSMLGDEAEHTYLTKGTYTAKLTVTDQGGKTATKEFPITVTDPPGNRAPVVEAAAVPASGQVPLDVLLTANGNDPDGDALTYAWDFGDGTTGQGPARAPHLHAGGHVRGRRSRPPTARAARRPRRWRSSSATRRPTRRRRSRSRPTRPAAPRR